MKIDAENPRYEAMLAAEQNPETIVDGTFCVVGQIDLIELWSFSDAENIYYAVKTSTLSKGFDEGVYNPSCTAGKAPLSEIYADNQETTYFDNQLEAHQFFCDFIMQNQLEGM